MDIGRHARSRKGTSVVKTTLADILEVKLKELARHSLPLVRKVLRADLGAFVVENRGEILTSLRGATTAPRRILRMSRVTNETCRMVARRLHERQPLPKMAQVRHMDWEDTCEAVADGFDSVGDFDVAEFLSICLNGSKRGKERKHWPDRSEKWTIDSHWQSARVT